MDMMNIILYIESSILFAVSGTVLYVLRSEERKRKELHFRADYKAALGEMQASTPDVNIQDLGSLVRLYKDEDAGYWKDGKGRKREATFLGTFALDVYYGGGEYDMNDIIANIRNTAKALQADAYTLSEEPIYVHRDTVVSAAYFKLTPLEPLD